MYKKILVVLLVLMLALGSLTGCGSSSTQSNGGSSNQSKSTSSEKVTLQVWIMPNSPQTVDDFLNVVKPFTDANPNIKIKVTVLDWGSAWTKITTAATSGVGPDVLQLGTTWVPAIASMGALEDLTDKVSDLGGASAFLPAAWNSTGIKNSGKTSAVPWFVDTRGIFYRTDVFEKAGIDPKQAFATWDSFLDAAKKINNMDINGQKIAAIGLPGKNDWNVVHNFASWIWGAGGDYLSPDDQHAVFNSQAALKGIDFYTGLALQGLVPKAVLEKNSTDVENLFAKGQFAMIFSGPWLVKNFSTPADKGGLSDTIAAKNYAVANLPEGPAGRFSFFGGSDLAIFKASTHKTEAYNLIKYLVTKEAQVNYAKVSGMLPALKEALDDPYITSDPHMAVFKEIAQYGRSYPAVPAWGQIENILLTHLGNVWDDVSGVKGPFNENMIVDEMNKAAEEVDGVLQQSK
ncbi:MULTISPECIES: sugar ABC transporter substrate-binding protein [Thermoanaerobacterium]|uniref:Extracellular solute-binding protein n=2 Tax=Thermoanaerobacterium TaxID=28895 RepID=W9EB71_9THEO|nr:MULTISPECIES: sugar ABC transporter substrate-binding protein [Thermoanaerobacterium]AFK85372.1 extracellular solute-binding protein family 1 [Thermoanaerobacterium saccharolyticum JW/SL-YS485]ETO39363.1 extracellular solute-binding protein [Thermoanaerobacterium aotearoense SCUT27]